MYFALSFVNTAIVRSGGSKVLSYMLTRRERKYSAYSYFEVLELINEPLPSPLSTCSFPVLLEHGSPHHEKERVEGRIRMIVRGVTGQCLSQDQQPGQRQTRDKETKREGKREIERNN